MVRSKRSVRCRLFWEDNILDGSYEVNVAPFSRYMNIRIGSVISR
jgi:hypothetical protein